MYRYVPIVDVATEDFARGFCFLATFNFDIFLCVQEQSVQELKDFQSKFNLKVGEGGVGAGGPATLSPTTPTVR
jgi:hypothetical protein